MSLHAFVDESRRNNTYLLAVALVSPGELAKFRKFLRGLLMPGQHELHCKKETPSRRKLIASRLVAERVSVRLYTSSCDSGDETARQTCLGTLIADLLKVDAHRLVLDSRDQRDRFDAQTIRTALGHDAWSSNLVYEHRRSTNEELLWIADVVAWCYGSGGEWRERVMPVVESIVELDCPWKARYPAADRPDVGWVHFLGLRASAASHTTKRRRRGKVVHPLVSPVKMCPRTRVGRTYAQVR